MTAGCTHTSHFDSSYLAAARRPSDKIADGKVLVHTSSQDDAYVYRGHPTSYAGSGTTLSVPIGTITKEAARAAFAEVFEGGADASNELDKTSSYRLVVAPKILDFTYAYNQLKNLGFAITPTVRALLQVRTLDAAGSTIWRRNYDSGDVEGASYTVETSPGELISQLAHKVLYDLLRESADDIRAEVIVAGKVSSTN